jgi:hypothetical protein
LNFQRDLDRAGIKIKFERFFIANMSRFNLASFGGHLGSLTEVLPEYF